MSELKNVTLGGVVGYESKHGNTLTGNYLAPRDDQECLMFNFPNGLDEPGWVNLQGYAIIPIEEYERLTGVTVFPGPEGRRK